MRIAFISADSDLGEPDEGGRRRRLQSGSAWWRCEVPARHIRANGHHAVHHPRLRSDPRTGEIVPVSWEGEPDRSGFDVVAVLRWMSPSAGGAIRRARAGGQVVVSDCDDWFEGLHAARVGAGLYFRNLDLGHYRDALVASSAVTVSTPYLADRLHGLGPPTYVVRNAIDLDRWRGNAPACGGTVVGWVGVTSWHPGDLETLRAVLGSFLRRHGFRFAHHGHASGDPDAAGLLDLPADLVQRVRPMVTIDRYPELFDGIDIGLVPLCDSPFNRAKCLDVATRLVSDRGPRPAGDVRTGDRVWNGERWVRVEAVVQERPRPGRRVTTSDGRELALTDDHRMLGSGGWVFGRDLRIGERLMTPCRDAPAITAVEPALVRPVDLQVAGGVFVAEGLVSHNSAVKGMEYAAAGIPFVAQATPEYEWFDPRATAGTPADWHDALERLADPQERAARRVSLSRRVADLDAAHRWRDWVEAYADASR